MPAFNPVDSHTKLRLTFEETTSTTSAFGFPNDGSANPTHTTDASLRDYVSGSPLEGGIAATTELPVVGTSFLQADWQSASSKSWRQGAPGLFGKRAFAMLGGPNTKNRDVLYLDASDLSLAAAAVGTSSAAWTMSQWVMPYTLGDGIACLVGKDYRDWNDADPAHDGLGMAAYTAPFVSWRIAFGDNGDGRWQIDWTTGGVRTNVIIGPTIPADGAAGIGLLRPRSWNLLGFSWSGGVLYLYLNGMLVHQVSIGAIDFGSLGALHWGGTLYKAANPEHLNGILGIFQLDDVARDADWWANYYMSAATNSGGAAPVVTF